MFGRSFLSLLRNECRGVEWSHALRSRDHTMSGPQSPATVARPKSQAGLVLLALVVGVSVGALLTAYGTPAFRGSAGVFDVIGTLWINAIRMTVIPLVATLTIVAVAQSGDAKQLGRLGLSAVGVFCALLLASGAFAAVLAPISFRSLHLAPDVAARLRESLASATATTPAAMPTLAQRIVDMVPANPIKAAADGAILPVVVFALTLGFALTRIPSERRDTLLLVCRGISDALLILVQWVLALAPIGVFALAVGLGIKMGASSAGALLHYVVTLSAILFAFTLCLYPVATVFGHVSLARFASAALPAQAAAFSARSSLAALPAMITAVRDTLHRGPRASGVVLPLAVSTFRLNVPIAWVVGMLFLGQLYGVTFGAASLVSIVITATLLSFSVPGLPSASLFLLSPVLAQHGIPVEGVGILIALDAIPDMFKTLANVTAHLTSAVVLDRGTVA